MIFGNLLTGIGDVVSKVVSQAGGVKGLTQTTVKTLAAAGKIKLPLTSEISSLEEKSARLRNYGYQLVDAGQFAQQLRGYKGTSAVLNMSISLITEAKQARDEITAADKLLAGAIAEGKATQNKMLAGQLPLTATANFFVKKAGADQAYTSALGRAVGAVNTRKSLQGLAQGPGKAMILAQGIPGAIGQTFSEAAGTAGEALQKIGEGAKGTLNYSQYLVPGLIAIGALYLALPLLKGFASMGGKKEG